MATTAELLAEAELAYHSLMVGRSEVEVRDSNGETVRFTPANASRLATYIQSLKAQIAAASGTRPATGPMRPIWG